MPFRGSLRHMGSIALPRRLLASQRACHKQPPDRLRPSAWLRAQPIKEDSRPATVALRQQHVRRTDRAQRAFCADQAEAIHTRENLLAQGRPGDAHRPRQPRRPSKPVATDRAVLEHRLATARGQPMERRGVCRVGSQRHHHTQPARGARRLVTAQPHG